FSMSLRQHRPPHFSTPLFSGKSECKNTTIFISTKIFFRFFLYHHVKSLYTTYLYIKIFFKNSFSPRIQVRKQHASWLEKHKKNDTIKKKSKKRFTKLQNNILYIKSSIIYRKLSTTLLTPATLQKNAKWQKQAKEYLAPYCFMQ
ncbi:MAG: hypothetical protein J6X58_07660, partial [Bacteroidales bacterium]|nr:hypothetical protein [Bacteroidales bacterium]